MRHTLYFKEGTQRKRLAPIQDKEAGVHKALPGPCIKIFTKLSFTYYACLALQKVSG
jgi:hypothetical protein